MAAWPAICRVFLPDRENGPGVLYPGPFRCAANTGRRVISPAELAMREQPMACCEIIGPDLTGKLPDKFMTTEVGICRASIVTIEYGFPNAKRQTGCEL
jgi:hypothetical protein